MPDRSVKMKRRIFGFQRRVWWPKCTPASSRSRIVATAIRLLLVLIPLQPAGPRADRTDAGTVALGVAAGSLGLGRAKCSQRGREVRRQRRAHLDRGPGERMPKREPCSVQELPFEPELGC